MYANAVAMLVYLDARAGSFAGPRGLRGTVLPGGADRQLLRLDGVKELDALDEMRTEDGAVIMLRNRALMDDSRTSARYARSVLRLSAPEGPHGWLNRRVFVGDGATQPSARPVAKAPWPARQVHAKYSQVQYLTVCMGAR